MRAIDSPNYLLKATLDREKVSAPDKYPYDLPLFKHFESIEFTEQVTFFVGENGSGKSTLLEALAVGMGFNAEGGTRNFHFAAHPSYSNLHEALMLTKNVKRPLDDFFLRAESFFNVATRVDALGVIRSYGGISLHNQSHGEAFMSLFKHRFQGRGLYILDEPEAALSPLRQMRLIRYVHELVKAESQFIIATHSPILLAYPGASIFAITKDAFQKVAYEETEQYKITKTFLDGYKYAIDELLRD
jgi:predicted ATPase